MSTEIEGAAGTIGPAVILAEEVPMVRQERWEELRRTTFSREPIHLGDLRLAVARAPGAAGV